MYGQTHISSTISEPQPPHSVAILAQVVLSRQLETSQPRQPSSGALLKQCQSSECLRCCAVSCSYVVRLLLVLPETVLWDAGPACCAGAVSDQRAKFDATLGWESEAMLPSNVCLDTDLVLSCSHALQPTVDVKFGSATETLRVSVGEFESGDQCFVLGENVTTGLGGFVHTFSLAFSCKHPFFTSVCVLLVDGVLAVLRGCPNKKSSGCGLLSTPSGS